MHLFKVGFNKHRESQEVPLSLERTGLRLKTLPGAGESVHVGIFVCFTSPAGQGGRGETITPDLDYPDTPSAPLYLGKDYDLNSCQIPPVDSVDCAKLFLQCGALQ